MTNEPTTTTTDRAAVHAEYRRLRADTRYGALNAGQALLWARSNVRMDRDGWKDRADGLGQSNGTRWADARNGLTLHATLNPDDCCDLSYEGELSATDQVGAYDRTENGTVGLDRDAYRYVVPAIDVAAERSAWASLGRHAADCAARRVWKSQRDTLCHYADGEVQSYYLRVRVTHDKSGVEVADHGVGGHEIDSFAPSKDTLAWLADSLRDIADEATREALDRVDELRDTFAKD